MYAYRGQIVGDREWRLNDGVAVASSSVVEFLEPFDDCLAVWGGYMPDSASLGRLAFWGVRQPIGQRIKATNQLPDFIRRSGYVDACGCLCHGGLLELRYRSIGRGALGATSPCFRISCQKSSGTFTFSAAISSAIRSGLLAPGMMAADAGCASEKCNAAALMGIL